MTWVKLDDRFPEHPKVAQVGPVARDLFVAALCYCNRNLTDGFVPAVIATKLCDFTDCDDSLIVGDVVERLVAAGLWDEAEGGYKVHDFLDYQPSSQKVRSSREQARERMQNIRSNNSRSSLNPVPVLRTEAEEEEQKQTAKLDSGLERVLSRVSDADETTLLLVEKLRRKGVPVGAFHSAYEALELRRGRKPKLRSEAAYFTGALNDMLKEGQYA